MADYPGRFIVIEGADGSGKTTQFNLLLERLQATGYDVEIFKFPQYDQESSHFVRSYLQGEYGPASKISPYAASIFYALDRYEAAPQIRKALTAGKIVLSDRYTGSNMGHQGTKFEDEAEQRGFFVWDDGFEFELLGIPRPDINLYLRVPPAVSHKLLHQRLEATGEKADQHEADKEHLAMAAKTYDTLCRLFPKDFVAIECAEKGNMLSIASINDKIWQKVRAILPPPKHKGHAAVIKLNQLTPQTSSNDLGKKTDLLTILESLGRGASVDFKLPKSFTAADGDYFMPSGLDSATAKLYRDRCAVWHPCEAKSKRLFINT